MNGPEIAVVMGHEEDLRVMKDAAYTLDRFGVPYEIEILALHQNPERIYSYAREIPTKNLKVIIAGASGAAHLPGVLASFTPIPVIGVPIKAENSIDGLDAIYSILQMPNGVPVAVMALNNAHNAAIFALQIMASKHPSYNELITAYKVKLRQESEMISKRFTEKGYETFWEQNKP